MTQRNSREISRRDFLEASIGAALVATVGCGSDGGDHANTPANGGSSESPSNGGAGTSPASGGTTSTTAAPSSGGATPGSTAAGTGLVSMVRGTDWVQATIDAIAMAGGLPDLSGKTVMLRPNVISTNADYTTSKDVIQGVIRAAKAQNASRIIVAEDGWNTGGDTIAAMKTLGIVDVCTAEGAEPMDLGKKGYTKRQNPNASAFASGIDFSDEVFNADYVINVPVCKSHSMAKFTMALKSWYGCTKGGRDHGNTWTAPAELHLFKQENFVVLDATKTTITGGPDSGKVVQSKVVVASRDAIAVDVTGLCVHKYSGGTVISAKGDVWNIHQIKRALALQFPGWLTSPQAFSYVEQGVTEHAEIMAWRMA